MQVTKKIASCKSCKGSFEAVRVTAKYCSNKCKQAGKNSKAKASKQPKQMQVCSGVGCTTERVYKGVESYTCKPCRSDIALSSALSRFRRSTIGLNIIRCIKRSGTIETFKSIDDLDYYTKLTRLRRRYESSSKVIDYNIMHLVASDDDIVSLTSKDNLFIGDAKLNKSLGNKAVFKGAVEGKHYIKRVDLDAGLLVAMIGEQASLWERFVKHFGERELSQWTKEAGFSPKSNEVYEPPAKNKESVLEVAFSQLLDSDIEVSLYFDLASCWSDYVADMNRFVDKVDYEADYASGVELIEVGNLVQESIVRNDGELIKKAIELLDRIWA